MEVTRSAGSILVLNSGSSSLKAALFAPGDQARDIRLLFEANATGIGQSEGKLAIKDFRGDPSGRPVAPTGEPDAHNYKSQPEALTSIAETLHTYTDAPPTAIGHRIVHGGMHLTRHQPLTPAVLKQLEQAVHFAPLHIPGSLELIRKSEELYPGVPQFACFDTAFHQTLPEHAWRLPIPREYVEAGVRRYGFHGLSYESIVAQLRQEPEPVPERLIVAHLGSGSSLAAILHGQSVDTSMGFTPAGGIPMATRTGDLDPGVLIYLMRKDVPGSGAAPTRGLSLDQAESLINHDAGLRGLSGLSDMQELEAAASVAAPANRSAAAGSAADPARAQLALQIFATSVAKTIAAYIVSLAGLDLLVFTGGIGEHDAAFRASVVQQLEPFGLRLDEAANNAHNSSISAVDSRAYIRVLPAQEDLQIARHVRAMLPAASG